MAQRDNSLDLLKGAACILMILSHAAIETRNPLILSLGFFGSFAAVLFFSVSGVTAWMQADRYSPQQVLPPYLILFLAGLSLNSLIYISFYKDFEIEMLQIIALGSALVYWMQRTWRPRPVHFFMAGILTFSLKLFFDLLGNQPAAAGLLSAPGLQGILLPPGKFTPLPWLFVFFLGAYAYQSSARRNLALASASVLLLLGILLITRDPAVLDLVNKWDMSIGYFLFACFCLFFSYYLAKRITFRENVLTTFLLFLGKNSLLFLYVHIFVINILYLLGAARLLVGYWLLVLILSALLIKLILVGYPKLNLVPLFRHKITWLILVLCVLVTPLLAKDKWVIFLLEFTWGVTLSMNYISLKELFKGKPTGEIPPLAQRSEN
jgi:fucose 4-O-acetylase-like acetyltransferase